MKTPFRQLIIAVGFWFVVLIIYSIVEYYVGEFEDYTFWQILTLRTSAAENYVFGIILGFFILFGMYWGRSENKRQLLASQLLENYEQKEKQRNEVDLLKSQFVANTSHELRTPLQSILGFTKLLLDDKVTDRKKQLEFLAIIDKSSTHLADLVDDLIDASRVEFGEYKLGKDTVSAEHIVLDSIGHVKNLADEKNIVLAWEIPKKLPDLYADRQRINQVMINLLTNAIKFSAENSKIELKASAVEKELLVQITDQGTGIPQEAIPYIFDRFYQVDGSITRDFGGSGLGLYITKQIIDAHKGSIWVDSTVGKGSTFSFTLPLNAEKNGN